MSSYSLFQEIKKHPWVLLIVIACHLGLAVLLGINLINTVPEASTAKHEKIINAVVINTDKFYQREKKKKQAQEIKKQQQTLKRKREAEKKKQQLEKKKQIKLKKEKIKKEKLRQKKLKKQKIIKEKARQQKIMVEKQRQQKIKKEQERLQQKKMADEKKRMQAEKLKKQKLEAAAKRKEEEKRRAEEKAEFEQALQAEEKQREDERLQAERAARLQSLRAQYVKLIAQKVENNWLRPPDSKKGQSCDVVVTQTITGDVIDVHLKSCNADNAFQRSVERAVQKASPLPMPPAPEVFDRKIFFTFKPK